MDAEDAKSRLHFFLLALLISYVGYAAAGTLIPQLGPRFKSGYGYGDHGPIESEWCIENQRDYCFLVWVLHLLFIFQAVFLSLRTGRISKLALSGRSTTFSSV